ncbi:MAG TPA: RDD family protein [Bryobacteraceae bacterium]|nr:RDD family protein [Bryobacteraceae bacterium]
MAVLEGLPLASFGARAAALVIDFLIALVLFLPIIAVYVLIASRFLPADAHIDIEFNFFHNWYSLVWLVLYFGVSLYIGKGQTIGKRLLRIRVVSLVHDHLSLWHCIERALGYGASALEGGFGFIQYFVHPNHRTVHDRIAETIVVRDTPPAARTPL